MTSRSAAGLRINPDFTRLWAAQAVSALGSRFTRTALPVIAILTLGGDARDVAWLAALSVMPGVLVGLCAGGFVDRTRKRTLLIWADLVRAILVASIPVAAWLDGLSLEHLYLVAAAAGAATTLFQIADNAFLPTLVGKDQLVAANARIEATDATAEITGPALAGILIQVVTAPVTLLLDALSFVWSAALLARIRAREILAPQSEARGVLARLVDDLRVGWIQGLRHPVVGPTFAALALQTFFGGFFFALYMLYTLRTLGLDAGTVGVIIGVGGGGALCGSLIARHMDRIFGLGPAMILALALGQAGSLLIPAAAEAGAFQIPFLVLHQFLGDGFLVAFLIHAVSLRQTLLPTEILGRVNATYHVAAGLLLPVGTLLAGVLADRIGIAAAVWIGVVGGLLAPLALLRPAILQLRRTPS
ncbi:MAG TPA: MFS transporter [Azospirillaceae bacterium]|nr:MFS transporter [Azospirillaceae bacterium]